MHRPTIDRYEWRAAERFDPSVILTITLGIAIATGLAGFL
jgi:hypothetical protein